MESQKYNFNDERWESFRSTKAVVPLVHVPTPTHTRSRRRFRPEEAVERCKPKYYAAGSLEPSHRVTRPASISSVKAHDLLA